ncbi:serine/arginine repetitive matrix protein 2-like [Saccostrea echinata]|uniref:serine/arginine repetitive matrix protein 2-like n=1 Tax=Saccostrea echinata TaxID=191078 RepID=UPI002A811A18|nr:serine/arginine repetitive matrix protein 2-like [Saccostrea echinata]
MYNGIGLQTARGSGTNGYVQRNLSFLRKHKDRVDYKSEEELKKLDEQLIKQPNKEILDHERKRKVELKCMEMQVLMEEQGYSADEIEKKVTMFRTMLVQKEGVSEATVEKDSSGRPVAKESHQIAQATAEKNARIKEAFGIGENYVDGSSFDPNRKAKEEQAKAVALAQKRYDIVRDSSSSERSPSPPPKRKKKKSSRDDSNSPERKEKKKKSKKRKRDRYKCYQLQSILCLKCFSSHSNKHSRSTNRRRRQNSSRHKRRRRKRRACTPPQSSQSSQNSSTDDERNNNETERNKKPKTEITNQTVEDLKKKSPKASVLSSLPKIASSDSTDIARLAVNKTSPNSKQHAPSRSPERLHIDRSPVPVQYKIHSSSVEKSQKPSKYKTPSPVSRKSSRSTRFESPDRYQTPLQGRSPTYTPDRKRTSSQNRSKSRSHSRSRSRSKRRRSYSWSHSPSRSYSRSVSRTPSQRRESRSPSIRRRKGSPSHLDKRRITSARKRPVPYYRPTPPSPSSDSDDSYYHYHRSRTPTRHRQRSRSSSILHYRRRSWSIDSDKGI